MSAIFTADGRLNTKEKRTAELKKKAGSVPISYRTNSTKEELCFEYIQTFLDQYKELYPKRNLPYMLAENEYGVKKFVCTTLRPTQLPIPELYDLHECASFLSGYIVYEPLDPPSEPPKTLYSPTQTLNSCCGDSFDCAMLMCSFLIGAGYDAYVVYGNAPRFVALRDQRAQECPLINTTNSASAGGKSRPHMSAGDDIDSKGNKVDVEGYEIVDNHVQESNYIAEAKQAEAEKGRDMFKLWVPTDDNHTSEDDNKRIKRCHAWVFVAAGRRDVKEACFIEPATGRPYSTRNSPFLNIVAMWNQSNYWVNLQLNTKTADMRFDLSDAKCWENLFLVPSASSNKDGDDNKEGEVEDGVGGHGLGVTEGKDNGEDDNDEDGAGYEINRAFDCPATWVEPLVLEHPKYLMRFPPTGKRLVLYRKAKAYFYARGVSRQAVTMRIILYLDIECTIVKEIHEWFENRADKIYKRVRYLLDDARNVDYYHPGSLGGVTVWTEYPGKRIEVDFNVDSRLDRLCRRVETIGSHIEEFFDGRSDLLRYRAIDCTTDPNIAGSRQFAANGGTLASELFVLKMVLKYDQPSTSKSTTAPAGPGLDDIATRIFSVPFGKLTSYYHFNPSKITGKVRTFLHTRGPSIPVMSDLALMQELGLEEDPDELQDAAAAEREAFAAIKGSILQFHKILEYRVQVEANPLMDRSVFDMALDYVWNIQLGDRLVGGKKSKGRDAQQQREGGGTENGSSSMDMDGNESQTIAEVANDSNLHTADYLAPFLRVVKDIRAISKEEALQVRQTCLDAAKLRLVERANIIQARLNDENAKLGRKQEQFQRSQREGDLSTEEYEKYCTDAMFRIQILEQRLITHEENALKKFLELDVRLSNDPRLKVLKTSER